MTVTSTMAVGTVSFAEPSARPAPVAVTALRVGVPVPPVKGV
jgi:hypothetical protein